MSGRGALPALLLLINGLMGMALYVIIEPMQTGVAKDRVALDRVVRQIRSTLGETNAELARMEENPEVYGRLIEKGLTRQQDRMAAAKILDRLRIEMGLGRIQYEFDPQRDVDDREFSRRGFTVVATTVRLTARSTLDGDFIRFTEAVLKEFPGQVQLKNLSMERELDSMVAAENAARANRSFSMVKGSAEFEWRTLKPYVKKTKG